MPFSALKDGDKFLVEDYAITSYMEYALLRTRFRIPSKHWNVAGFGASEFSPTENLPPLDAVPYELNGIVLEDLVERKQLIDHIGVLPGQKFLNEAFTVNSIRDAPSNRDIKILHFASHFILGATAEESYLLAGNGKHITIPEFKAFNMARKELVTLSACETAVNINAFENNGKEVEGLALTMYGTNYAQSVLATLWNVADQSTADFMIEFYKLRESEELTKAEAIRRVQQRFIRGEDLSGKAISKEYKHPFYWAPFVLMGSWL